MAAPFPPAGAFAVVDTEPDTRAALAFVRADVGAETTIMLARCAAPAWNPRRRALTAPALDGGPGLLAKMIINVVTEQAELILDVQVAAPRPMQLMARVTIPAHVLRGEAA